METSKNRRGHILKDSISFVLVVVFFCCLLVLMFSMLRLPEISLGRPYHTIINRKVFRDEELGKFADMMIGMLPEDLAFTVFVPSEKAFETDLRLQVNDSLVGENVNNTYAILSRILGFSTTPRTLSSLMVPFGEKISYDSLSGFTLYISKALDGMLVVNRVKSERVDLKKGKIIIHLMAGVIMDADFEQSVQPDYNEEA